MGKMSNKEFSSFEEQIAQILKETGWSLVICDKYDVIKDAEETLKAAQQQKAIKDMNA